MQTRQGTTTYKHTAPPTNPATECGYTNHNTHEGYVPNAAVPFTVQRSLPNNVYEVVSERLGQT